MSVYELQLTVTSTVSKLLKTVGFIVLVFEVILVKVTVLGETLHCISPVKFLVLAFKVITLVSFNSPFSSNGIIYLSAVSSKVVASSPFNANVYEKVLLNSTPSTVIGTFNVPEGVFILVATFTVNLEAVVPLLR